MSAADVAWKAAEFALDMLVRLIGIAATRTKVDEYMVGRAARVAAYRTKFGEEP